MNGPVMVSGIRCRTACGDHKGSRMERSPGASAEASLVEVHWPAIWSGN